MKNRNCKVLVLALLALALSTHHTCAQSVYTPYAFTTLAGNAGYGSTDGTVSGARFWNPGGVAVDTNGNVYVADGYNSTIRKVTPAGAVTTLAGLAGSFGTNDGTGSAARFASPSGVAVDRAGNVYVADTYNHTIRKVTPAGEVTTLAGLAVVSGTNDGTGSVARFSSPSGVAVDTNGNVYVADQYNHTIRKVVPVETNWVVTTLAGLAGSYGGTDGTGSGARFWYPYGVAVDDAGNVYVGDSSSYLIRKVTPAGVVTTLAELTNPQGVAVDSTGNIYVALSDRIMKLTAAGGVTTLAGLIHSFGSADGTGSDARFFLPYGVAVDTSGNVYVADTVNNTIRKVTSGGVVTTLAGVIGGAGNADGTGSAARFWNPHGVAVNNASNVYVADSENNTIRQVTPAGEVATLAGLAGSSGTNDGTGSAARFAYPYGVAVGTDGNIYVAGGTSTIRKVTPAGEVTTLAGLAGSSGTNDGTGSDAQFSSPKGVAVDSEGNLYVADTDNHTIRKVTPTGEVTTLAGLSQDRDGDGYPDGGDADGTGSAARFNFPSGVAVDSAGNVYVADTWNNTIRKLTPARVVTTLAGSAGQDGSTDGMGNAARFHRPTGVAVDSAGNLYVADAGNHTIRKVAPTGMVTTLGGMPDTITGSADGTGSAARFNGPSGVAVDSAGNLYVADSGNHTIRKGTPLLQFETGNDSLTVSNGFFQMRLTGPSGSSVVVEASADLAAWTAVQTNSLPPAGLDVSVPLGTNQNQFFRARLP